MKLLIPCGKLPDTTTNVIKWSTQILETSDLDSLSEVLESQDLEDNQVCCRCIILGMFPVFS
jgi:hypothetical protein